MLSKGLSRVFSNATDSRVKIKLNYSTYNFPGSAVVKNLPADAGDTRDSSLSPGLRRSPGGGLGNLLQYSYLRNSMDRGAWWGKVHGVAKSQT